MTSPESRNVHGGSGVPSQGRLLGIDYGTVRIGVAICDENQSIASPLKTYNRRNEKLDAEYFQSLVADQSIVGIVVGLPLHMSGDESQKSSEARLFGNWLSEITGAPISWIDERYSTALARELLEPGSLTSRKRKDRIDKVAAQAILAAWLESSCSSDAPNQSLGD